jgi:hypothetical protein
VIEVEFRTRHRMPFMTLPLSPLSVIVAAAAMSAPVIATAAGLGTGLSMPVLGQALDFAVSLRTDPGETLVPECAHADVMLGDRRLPPPLVRTAIETLGPDAARVRVVSAERIDEPVVTLTITVGCTSRVSRQYVLLVDPPAMAPAVAAPAFAANPAPVPMDVGPAAGSSAGRGTDARTAPVSNAGPERLAAPRPAPQAPRREASVAPTSSAGSAAPRSEATAAAVVRKAAPRPARRLASAAPPVPAAAAPEAVSRLKLELEEPVRKSDAQAVEQALEAVAQAASAARAAASAASAASERITSLERTVEQLRGEAKTQRDLATQLRERLASSEGAGRWVTPLLVLLALLAGTAVWLAWRLYTVQREREMAWHQAAAPSRAPAPEPAATRQPTSPIPFVTSEIASGSTARVRATSAWPPPAPAEPWAASATAPFEPAGVPVAAEPETMRTLPVPPSALADIAAARDVSVEELIDLEQQAEFFVVLGQDEAAIDLLIEHLRHTGGASPLPYLKLLEIYRRRGDREAYERMRSRFNRRFNAYAPEWGVDLAHGRTLEDYPGVVPRLQQLWQRPMDAMAELEALLFRKSRGDLFDLPAYREVLFLYALARDLLDRESIDAGSVDLLLPLADGAEFGVTAPHPHLGLEGDDGPPSTTEERATAPLDLDIGRNDKPTSIFDPLDDSPPPARRH